MHKPGPALRQGNGDSGRNHGSLPRRELRSHPRVQVNARISGTRSGWQWQIRIQLLNEYLNSQPRGGAEVRDRKFVHGHDSIEELGQCHVRGWFRAWHAITVTSSADFREWLLPSFSWWLLAPGFGFGMMLALWPLGTTVAFIGAGIIAVLTVGLLAWWAPRTEVSQGVLRVGPAHIETKWLGPGRELRGEELRAAMGPELDLRTWVHVRPWMKSAVMVENIDPQDPAPAWIIASRRPAKLLQVLGTAPGENSSTN